MSPSLPISLIISVYSKLDEANAEERLQFVMPQHEFFHQYMVIADVENQLFRDRSRGLAGGSFLLATLLNRKDAKSKKGKDAVEAFREFFLLKADATFCSYFLHKFKLNDKIDNTPHLLRSSSSEKKMKYLHQLVAEALKDLLPYFKEAETASCQLDDFPLAAGRRNDSQAEPKINICSTVLEAQSDIDSERAEATASQLQNTVDKQQQLQDHMVHTFSSITSSRSRKQFCCSICSYKTKYEAICLSHIESCLKKLSLSSNISDSDQPIPPLASDSSNLNLASSAILDIDLTSSPIPNNSDDPMGKIDDNLTNNAENLDDQEEVKPDRYWNYKTSEFLVDSLFALSTIYEKYGNGLGMLIMSKMLLPIFHGLKHSNYTSSIHRFITRILCEATPKEGLKLIHERFSNKEGKIGGNIFKDRRMEHRIGTLKRLIGNLGPNFDEEHVQLVNKTVEIKEELFYQTRKSHGIEVRSGNHVARDDTADYNAVLEFLAENDAHMKKEGRIFGDYDLPEDLFGHFDRAEFYRWISVKNEEAAGILRQKRE